MKKNIAIAFIAVLFGSVTCLAQSRDSLSRSIAIPDFSRNEFRIEYGRVSLPGIASVFGMALGSAFAVSISGNTENSISIQTMGASSLGYYRYLTKHIALGGDFTCEILNISTEKDPSSDSNMCFFTLLPGVKARWFDLDHFGMYSKANAGADVSTSDDGVSLGFAFQLSPIGIEAGGKKLRGFAELGIGFQGLLAAGISYRF